MRDFLGIDELNREEIEGVFTLAREMEVLREMGSDLCKGKILATIFYEPSTRTRLSFESAMLRLGGSILGFADPQTSSVAKDETLADTIQMVRNYADLIVIRHFYAGAARLAAQHSSVAIINAGDDAHQHPTQALTDLYTLWKRRGDISGLTVGICGDLLYGRAAHSLAYGLALFGAKVALIAPPSLGMPDDVAWRLKHLYDATLLTVEDPREIIGALDVIYVNRLQKERLPKDMDSKAVQAIADAYRVDGSLMRSARPDCLILHPLPRVNELARELDDDPRAMYFEQSSNGVPIRMALMALLLGRVRRPLFADKPKTIRRHESHVCANPSCVTRNEPRVEAMTEVLDDRTDLQACFYCQHLTRG